MRIASAYWYYGLVIISLILLLVSLLYKKDWKLLVLELCVAGVIHPFEVVIFILLDAYHYLPGILSDPTLDNYLGSYISNALIVPCSAVLLNALSLSWDYTLGFAAAFTGIDWYFAAIGIFHHYWWKSIFSGIGISILYAISKQLWSVLQQNRPRLIFRLAVIYLCYSSIHNLTVFLINKGGQLFRFAVPWSGNPEKYHQGLFYLYLITTSVIITGCVGLKMRLRYRLLGIVILVLGYWATGEYHIFVPRLANISAWQLILVPIIVLPIVTCLFRAAALNYLFPSEND